MHSELLESLHTRHPRIFRVPDDSPDAAPSFCGVYCGDGWFTLIDVLCQELQCLTDRQGDLQVVVSDVKEKYGSLHFYVGPASDEQYAMISLAEELSERTCEVCGAPGAMDDRPNVWVTTRCEQHRGK